MTFQLPAGLSADSARELERTCVAGGSDNMPWPTELRIRSDQLSVTRSVDESGFLVVPWDIDSAGRLMGTTATLMERGTPYNLVVELARGKINQLRSQAYEWRTGGLQLSRELEGAIHRASQAFVRAVVASDVETISKLAGDALTLGYEASQRLVRDYLAQVFNIRHQRQAKLEATLGCRLCTGEPPQEAGLQKTFNAIGIPMSWSGIEAEQSVYSWGQTDALLQWSTNLGLQPSAGPLIDFSSASLPAWLWWWERDLPSLATFMCKFVENAVRRYRGRIRRWQITAASNCATVLSLTEDELLSLTYRLVETARSVDSTLELVVGIAQPWGEYMATEDRTHSPFVFADTLIRSGLNLAALDIELVMGITPRGSYCRDLLETSRMLDLYAQLGVPLRISLGYPADESPDPDADPEMRVAAGQWHTSFTPPTQADWAADFASLALCKPFVQGIQWVQISDAVPHQFPHCGLFDSAGHVRPALDRLRALRQQHLA